MSQILIRNVDDNIKTQLQLLAKLHGNSMEEELRNILKTAVEKKYSHLGTEIASYFKDISIPHNFEIKELRQPIRNPFEE